MSTLHFHQTGTSTPEQFLGAHRLRTGLLKNFWQQRERVPQGTRPRPSHADVFSQPRNRFDRPRARGI